MNSLRSLPIHLLLASLLVALAPQLFADLNHAADDEFAAAAAALAPKFDPKRDAITIEKVMAEREAAAKAKSKNSKKKGKKRPKNKSRAVAKNATINNTGPDARGTWSSVIQWTPHIPVTASLLPNGRLLTFASNQRTTFPGGPEFTYAAVWDPATGQFVEVNNNRHDMFCGGTALLPDGRLVINGGRNTTRLSSIFDWQANRWNAIPDMNDPRWYNTSLVMPDASVFTVSGSGGSNTAELWSEATGWRRLSGIGWSAVTAEPGYINIWHPLLMLAPNGNLFHFGPTDRMNWVTTSGSGSLTYSGNNVPGTHYPKEGAFAMYNDGRILVVGGGANTTSGSDSTTGTSSTATYKVDLRGSSPVVTSIAPMALARQFHNSVVLPNGEVMIIGGNGGVKFSDAASVLTPEIWNPTTETWRTTANHAVPRNYHSVALLLPDGRVWSGGGGLGGNAADHRDAEIFTPPMLYNASGALATRPVISSVPAKVSVGGSFTVNATPNLARFTMIRLSAVTHSVNTDQRFLEASFTQTSSGVYRITSNNNANIFLPGYWMLFGIDSAGVHSVSRIFQVERAINVALTNPGNQSGHTGEAVSLPLTTQSSAGATLAFSATGLPTGLSINPTTGTITGTPSVTGSFNVGVTVTDSITTATQNFTWTLAPQTRSHQFASFTSSNGLSLNGASIVASPRLALTTATIVTPITPTAPNAVSGLSFWLDSTDSSTMRFKGSTVNEWRSKVGTAKMTRQNGSPTLVNSGIGGRPTVRFTSSSRSEMRNGVNHSGPVTVLYVSRQTGGSNQRVLSAVNNNWLLGYWGGRRGSAFFNGDVLLNGNEASDTNPHLYAATIPGSGQNSTVWGDGVQLASNQGGTAGPNNLVLGGGGFNQEHSNCEISEVLIYNRVLTASELNSISSHLSTKYGLNTTLTPPVVAQASSAWLTQSFPVRPNTSFVSRFVFRQSGTGDGGEGFTFTVQGSSSTALGGDGNSLGYGGINNSLAVEFDSFVGTNDPNANHVGVLTNGNVTSHLTTHTPSFDMEGGLDHTAWVEYDGPNNNLRVYLSQTATSARPATPVITLNNIDLAALVGSQAWFGFTAATGRASNAHEIIAWDMAMDANKLPSLSLPPVLTNPGALTSVTGTAVSRQIIATDPENDPLTFSATNLPPGLSISPGGLITGTPTTTGSRTVTLTVADSTNPPVSTSFQWTVNAPFTLSQISGGAVSGGASQTFTINATGGNNLRYKWNFGDGSPETPFSSSPNATYTFANPGRYLVTVTVTDDTGRILTSSFYQGVSAALTTRAANASSTIIVERRSTGNHRVWVANPDANTVAVLDAVTRARLAEIPVATFPRTLAVAPDGRIWVACARGASISIINPTTLTVTQSLAMPRGSRPFGIAFDPTGSAAWLTLEATGRLLKLNPSTGATLANLAIGSDPRHLSISHDGTRVLVSRFITPPIPGEDTATVNTTGRGGEVIVVNAATNAIDRTVILRHSEALDTSLGARGIPNYLGAPVITPDGFSAWIPSKQDNIKRGTLRDGNPLTHDSAIRPIASRIDLTNLTEHYPSRIDFNDAGTPTAVCHDPSGILTFVALEGSRSVAVVDAWNRAEITRFDVGRAPQGLTLSADGNTLFVQNFMDRNVTAHNVTAIRTGANTAPTLLATVSTVATEPLAPAVLQGKKLFYDTRDNRLALQEYISCASCHADAGHDGRTWDFTGFGEGLRNTTTLHGQAGQGPFHWTGNFDEIQDFESQIREFAGGTGLIANGNPHPSLGLPNAARSGDLDALAAYLGTLTSTEVSPARQDPQTLPASAARGREVFLTANCASCHSGTEFTNSALGVFRDVGTYKPSSGKRLGTSFTGFDVPTLRGLWSTAPYLHDGSAPTIAAAVTAHSGVNLTSDQLTDLENYLLNIDEEILKAPANLNEFTDTFDDPSIDSTRWQIGTPFGQSFAPIDPLITVNVSDGKLRITPRTNSPIEGYSGLVSKDAIDFRGSALEVRVDPSGGSSNTWLALSSGTNNFLVIGRDGAVIWFEQTLNGNRSGNVVTYNPTTQKFWRIRHDAASDRILYQLSPDGLAWTTIASVPRIVDITAMRVELGGGSYVPESAPGVALFDHVVLSRPPVAPAIASFSASPQQISAGESSTLSWTLTPGSSPLTSLAINGQNILGTEQFIVTPSQTTTYTLTATSAVGSATSSTTVTIRPTGGSSSYPSWASTFGGTGIISADADGDSYPEGLEYALGLDPSSGSSSKSTLPGANPAISRGVRLERTATSTGALRFDLVFTRSTTPLPDIGAAFRLEHSLDMETWTTSANLNGQGTNNNPSHLEISVTNLGDGTEEVRSSFRDLPRYFVRLAVDLPGGTVYSAPFGWLKRSIHVGENLISPPFAPASTFGGNFTTTGSDLTDATASWTANQWQGHFIHVTSGPAEGTMLRVSSNTNKTLSFEGESPVMLARLSAGSGGSYVLRPCHTIAGLFGANNRDSLVSGSPSTADLVELVAPNSSLVEHYFDGNWKPTASPTTNAASVIIHPTEGIHIRRRSALNTDLHFSGEVILGKRAASIRSGFTIPGTWNPIEKVNIDTLGVNSFFTPSDTATFSSNIYLEIGTAGGLYPHYLKTGAGWRYFEGDTTPAGTAAFQASQSWLFVRYGAEQLWVRNQPFTYGRPLKVACVGDSITQGIFFTNRSYPEQLQEMLGENWQVGNYGMSGTTLLKKGDYPYWQQGVYLDALNSSPDVVIIMLGTNDTKPEHFVFRDEYSTDYAALIKSFQDLPSKPRIYLCKPSPIIDPGAYEMTDQNLQFYIQKIDALANQLGLSVIDMHAALTDKPQLLPDRLHPNEQGLRELAKKAYTALTGKVAPN